MTHKKIIIVKKKLVDEKLLECNWPAQKSELSAIVFTACYICLPTEIPRNFL